MATIKFIVGIICLAAFGGYWLHGSSALATGLGFRVEGIVNPAASYSSVKNFLCAVVKDSPRLTVRSQKIGITKKPLRHLAKNSANIAVTSKILSIARNEIGVREKTGRNDGENIEAYLRYAGGKKGNPWCAAFVSWVFGKAGYGQPRTVWSPALFPSSKLRSEIQPAMVFGIYFPSLKRIAHCGVVESKRGDWVCSIEGNTNVSGSREGDGVYRKWRPLKTVRCFADWIKKERTGL